MTDFQIRLTRDLEPILKMADPREKIGAYHDMPYAIFQYEPSQELALRTAVASLQTRLDLAGKRVVKISLAECLTEALQSEGDLADWFDLEKRFGAEKAIEDIHALLAERTPLVDLVAARMPPNPDAKKVVAFILRTGALFPVYRTFSLLEQLKGRVEIPTVLFYPGDLDGAAGLRFMGVLDAEHNYRPKIF